MDIVYEYLGDLRFILKGIADQPFGKKMGPHDGDLVFLKRRDGRPVESTLPHDNVVEGEKVGVGKDVDSDDDEYVELDFTHPPQVGNGPTWIRKNVLPRIISEVEKLKSRTRRDKKKDDDESVLARDNE